MAETLQNHSTLPSVQAQALLPTSVTEMIQEENSYIFLPKHAHTLHLCRQLCCYLDGWWVLHGRPFKLKCTWWMSRHLMLCSMLMPGVVALHVCLVRERELPDELIRCHQNWLDLSSDVSFHLCMLLLEQRQFLMQGLLLFIVQISSHLLSGTTSEKPASVFILPPWRQTY